MADEAGHSGADKSGSSGEIGGYRVLKYLGGGGMGKVFLVESIKDGRKVALKTIRSAYHGDAHLLKRFYNEARTAASLQHPNIVPVEHVFREKGVPYMIMPYLEGSTLGHLVYHQRNLKWTQALKIVGQIASALAYAHDRNIVHRDVKPDNIFIDKSGRARILDFGLAKLTTSNSNLTVPGMVIGTPAYMAPEQCKGSEATTASDVYSLGVVLYQALSGKRPYQSDNPIALTQMIIVEAPPPLDETVPDLPADVLWLVHNMMHKEPKQRLAAAALCDIIADVLLGKPLHTSSGMAEAMSALRAELLADPTKLKLGSNLDTPSALDGVDLARRTPSNASTLRPKVPQSRWLAQASIRICLLLLLTALGAGGAYLWMQQGSATHGLSALQGAQLGTTFKNISPAVVTFSIQENSLRYRPLGWVGRGETLMLWGRDTAGGAEMQWQGIAVADLAGKNVYRLIYGNIERGLATPFLSTAPPGSPFGQGIFHFTSHTNPTGPGKYRELVFQPAGSLASTVCFRADPTTAHTHDERFNNSLLIDAALHADGKTLALLLSDQASKQKGLYERRIDALPPNEVKGPYFELQGDVRLIGFAPTGGHIAFRASFQDRKLQRNEVFAIRMGASRTPMKSLGPSSSQGTAAAFHPTKDLLLVSYLRDDAAYAIYATNLSGADAGEKQLGEGRISEFPWHPSGAYFVATAPDDSGDAHLFAVYPEQRERVRLTGPNDPIGPIGVIQSSDTAVISPDGARLAVRLRNSEIACAKLDAVPLSH